jgi:hypothetical protein
MERRRCPITTLIHQFKVRTCCTPTHTRMHTHTHAVAEQANTAIVIPQQGVCVSSACALARLDSPLDTTSRSQSCSSCCVVCRGDVPRAGWWRAGLLAHLMVCCREAKKTRIRLSKNGMTANWWRCEGCHTHTHTHAHHPRLRSASN